MYMGLSCATLKQSKEEGRAGFISQMLRWRFIGSEKFARLGTENLVFISAILKRPSRVHSRVQVLPHHPMMEPCLPSLVYGEQTPGAPASIWSPSG